MNRIDPGAMAIVGRGLAERFGEAPSGAVSAVLEKPFTIRALLCTIAETAGRAGQSG